MDVLSVVIIGAVAGVFHQLVDRAKMNDIRAFIRGAIVGAIAAWVASVVYSNNMSSDEMFMLGIFAAGYAGDSLVLNVLERFSFPISAAVLSENTVESDGGLDDEAKEVLDKL